MRSQAIKLAAIVTLVGCAVMALMISDNMSDSKNELTSTGRGSVENLLANYKQWEVNYVKNGGDRNMILPIGPFKGLSTESSKAHGRAVLNLVDGSVSVEVKSLPKNETWDVWLVENRADSSVMPEEGDTMLRVGSLSQNGGEAKLEITLGTDAFAKFEPDLIAVTRAGKSPAEDRLLVGMTTLFQRLYRSGKRGRFGNLGYGDEPAREASSERLWQRLVGSLSPPAHAQIGPNPDPTTDLEFLIAEGRRSFFNDTFEGNGRTCGTCHRENRNLTIDPEFIATLPPNDPLFVAEFVPALANLEKPELMRKFGLILENVDGFDNPGVMRGVPHTLALLASTLTPAPFVDGTTIPPLERTGWGGDGAPGNGTLREFIIGAIIQHYPKTLNRIEGEDFILPTMDQLDALEMFQKSIGRRQDLDLTNLILNSPVAERGKLIFNNPGNDATIGAGKCAACHKNAGASINGVHNANFNTNVEGLPDQPARLVDLTIPRDGGFGQTGVSPTGGIGDGTFNTTVVVEAADTGPFFHNNSIRTIEGAVAFYNSAAFNASPAAAGLAFIPNSSGPGIQLETTEVEAVAAFLRVINALENFRSTFDLLNRAKGAANASQSKELMNLALSEIDDAYRVLAGGGLHPETQLMLGETTSLVEAAVKIPGKCQGKCTRLINQALAIYEAAEDDLRN